MSQRDLTHLLNALATAARAQPGIAVPVTQLDEAIGRGRNDMRTPLNLASLEADGLVRNDGERGWSLTEAGIARLRDDDEPERNRESRPHLH